MPTMKDSVYNYMFQLVKENGSHNWCCKSCTHAYTNLRSMINAVSQRVENNETNITQNTRAIQGNSSRIEEIKKKVDEIEVGGVNKEFIQEAVNNQNTELFDELNDRESRKANLIVHGMEEARNGVTDINHRKNADLKILGELVQVMDIDVREYDIKFTNRLGPRKQNGEPRPMIVGLRDTWFKDLFLKNAHRLKDSVFEHVRIVPDLTKLQREQDQNKYREAERLNEENADLNYEWRVGGARGLRRLYKARLPPDSAPQGMASQPVGVAARAKRPRTADDHSGVSPEATRMRVDPQPGQSRERGWTRSTNRGRFEQNRRGH